jgi:hypothetical protein
MMIALCVALGRTLSVASAITEARQMQPGACPTPSGQTSLLGRFARSPEEAR